MRAPPIKIPLCIWLVHLAAVCAETHCRVRRRVVNRFSSDIHVTDNQLAGTFTGTMQPLFQLVSVVIVVEMAVPEFLLFYVPVMYFYIKFARIYRQSGREIKRLNSNSKSPIFRKWIHLSQLR